MNVNNLSGTSTQTMGATKQTDQQSALGQDAFMKILVTQMKNQNPLEPLKDTEFIAQMAQFSSLEQLTTLNKSINQFIGTQGKNSLPEQAHLIGNIVQWKYEINGQMQSGEGVVKALSMKKGEILVELEKENLQLPIEAIHRIEKQIETKNEQEMV